MNDVQTFVDQYPKPPDRQRGDVKRTVSVVLTEPEAKVLAKVAASEAFRNLYNGHQSELLRHAFHHFVYRMEELVDMDWLPEAQEMIQRLEEASMIGNRDAIVKYLDHKGTHLNLLLDYGEMDGALTEYDEFLDYLAGIRAHWRRIIDHQINEHAELQRFLSRVESSSLENTLALKIIAEKVR